MVVISHSIFVPRDRPCGLDTPHEALLDEHVQGVVYRLTRNGTDPAPNRVDEFVGGGMGMGRNSFGDRHPLSSHMYAAIAQALPDVCLAAITHASTQAHFPDSVKTWTKSGTPTSDGDTVRTWSGLDSRFDHGVEHVLLVEHVDGLIVGARQNEADGIADDGADDREEHPHQGV